MTSADVIELRGLRVVSYCGALPEEQVRAQPFEFDVDVWTDLARAGGSDRLDDTVDYGALCGTIAATALGARVALMEHLAQLVADAVLATEAVDAVAVTVRKLRPPVPQDLATAGVRIHRANHS
ncbi:MAG: dihydroneopterin aldolase [Actinobacteria bacterium]|nr:dihydroneopterin aldolase [Actinomycetota bacterium]